MAAIEEPENQGDDHAQDDGRGQGKVEDGIFPADNDVARQATDRQV